MTWIIYAICGHLLNAVAFIVDKMLLTSAFKKSSSYAALIGTISLAALIATPWIKRFPSYASLPIILAFGSLFVFALWSFFEAMKHGEASRVVPVVGSLIPLFTIIGTATFLHERLTMIAWVGFILLLLATVILSSGSAKQRLSHTSIGYGVCAAILFAAASVCGKYAFEQGDFLSVFVLSRLAAGVTGIVIALVVPGTLRELRQMSQSSKKAKKDEGSLFTGRMAAHLAIFGQLCGALGFVGVTLALAQGSAPLVNAMQAIQYAIIVLVAWVGGARLRRLMHETVTGRIVVFKTIAILLVGIGLACITRNG